MSDPSRSIWKLRKGKKGNRDAKSDIGVFLKKSHVIVLKVRITRQKGILPGGEEGGALQGPEAPILKKKGSQNKESWKNQANYFPLMETEREEERRANYSSKGEGETVGRKIS